MGLLKDLFKRKPGGTFFGNLLRGAVKQVPVVGNILGNGAMMISQVDADKRDLSDSEFELKYNAIKSNVQSDGSISAYLRETAGAGLAGAVDAIQDYQDLQGSSLPKTGTLKSGGIKAMFQKYKEQFIGFGLSAVALIYFIVKRKR